MTDAAAPDRLAAFLRYLREGLSQRQAALVSGCARTTVLRERKRNPAFAAALTDALAVGSDIRKAEGDEAIREQYFAHALDLADNHHRDDAPSKRDETRKGRRLLAKLHGHSPALFPGCSPSHSRERDDPLERMSQRHIRAKMQEAFARRRAEKRGEQPKSEPFPSGSPKRGRAGTLWD